MKILVTGGAGFIGSAVIRHVIAETEHAVVNVDALTYAGNLASLGEAADSERYAFERVDIGDAEALREVFARHQPEAVMHLAAESHVDRSIHGPADFIQTNLVGTGVLLEVAREYYERLDAPRRAALRFAFTMSRPMRSTAILMGRRDCSPRKRPTRQARLIPRARRGPIIWCVPGIVPLACRYW